MKKLLYLGLEVPDQLQSRNLVHYPIIRIIPRLLDQKVIDQFHAFTHLIFTSKSAVEIFFNSEISLSLIKQKQIIAVGQSTAKRIQKYGVLCSIISEEETSEGVVSELDKLDLEGSFILWPHSALSRNVIPSYLEQKNINFLSVVIYDTVANIQFPLPDLNDVEEIMFTSPSTIDAFLEGYKMLPKDKLLTCIGPVTLKHLKDCSKMH